LKSVTPGDDILRAEVLDVSSRGFRLLVAREEFFVPFEKFPWFRDATVAQVSNVSLASPDHLYWADLDIDLAVESVRNPEKFPLVSRSRA
jgi:hypothetical protein